MRQNKKITNSHTIYHATSTKKNMINSELINEPIKYIHAREILDSRGNPTIEVDLSTQSFFARAMVPSGASTGIHEAIELRDKDKRYKGKGVLKAKDNVNKKIAKKKNKILVLEQKKTDKMLISLDGTPNKSKLGANAILGVSMANCRLGAMSKGTELFSYISELYTYEMGTQYRRESQKNSANKKYILPVPFFNVINGGKHAGNKLNIQEFMIAPIGANSFSEALRMGAETYQILKELIREKHGVDAVNVGDEGGFAPPLENIEEPLELLCQAIDKAGYKGKIKIALDCAASEFFDGKMYSIDGRKVTGDELLEIYESIVKKYPIISIEDPFDQEDFESYSKLTRALKGKVQIVGDDLLVTNVSRINTALKKQACNALLLKVNQIGTVSESLAAASLAIKNGWNVMVSHRSGETEDSFIADLVVGIGSGQIKSGAPCRGERLAKYNQLLRIEEKLGKNAIYAGKTLKMPK